MFFSFVWVLWSASSAFSLFAFAQAEKKVRGLWSISESGGRERTSAVVYYEMKFRKDNIVATVHGGSPVFCLKRTKMMKKQTYKIKKKELAVHYRTYSNVLLTACSKKY